MGLNMARRLRKGDHDVIAYSRSTSSYADAEKAGVTTVGALSDLVQKLAPPRAVWVMVPAGKATQQVIEDVSGLLAAGDLVVDGGNSNFNDSLAHAELLQSKQIDFLDVGTSGGVWGLQVGYCMMVGGAQSAVARIAPALDTLAPPDGWAHVGPNGAGHYVKMVHNGIEYGVMAAYAEGFEILERTPRFDLDLRQIAHLWNQGSVIRSWLLELAEDAFAKDARLEAIKDYVSDSGEGRWTVAEAIAQDIPAPIITLALLQRLRSRQETSFSAKVLAALRNEFGGHEVKRA